MRKSDLRTYYCKRCFLYRIIFTIIKFEKKESLYENNSEERYYHRNFILKKWES